MGFLVWMRFVVQNRAAVSPSRWLLFLSITLLSPVNSLLRVLSEVANRKALRQASLPEDPIFILGHWRSGTTYLHELMMLDERFAAPSTYQCFAPGHFLLTESLFRRFGGWLLPSRRPIDNVRLGWDRPQEDEFALMNLGAPSAYRRIAFPGKASSRPEALDLANLDPHERSRWIYSLTFFLTRLRVKEHRRLVLKSPTHTARLSVLSDLFPGARYIHITRHPYALIPSTKRLWQALHVTQSLQSGLDSRIDSYIYSCFSEIRNAFKRDRRLLACDGIYELRYEDLVRDPIASLRAIYGKLRLGDFAPMEQALRNYLSGNSQYKTNSYILQSAAKDSIVKHCRDYFDEYQYTLD